MFDPAQSAQLTLLAEPAGCEAMYSSPITITYGGSGSFTAINLYYLCEASVTRALEALQADVTGLGPGRSLANKIESVLAALEAGDPIGACGTLGAFINQVEAQRGKKIGEATAADLIGRAQAIGVLICGSGA